MLNQGTLRILFWFLSTSYLEIILEATICTDFSYPDIGVIFEIYILSRSHNLEDADPAGTLDSCFGKPNGQKNTK